MNGAAFETGLSDPTNVGCFFAISFPPSADSAKINITRISTNGKQNAARRLEATQGKHGFLCYIFRLWVIIKALLKQISLYLLSHFCIRVIVLTCPDNKSSLQEIISRNHACLKNHTNHIILFHLKSSLPFSLFLFVWRLESTTTKSLLRHLNSGIAEDLHCSKAVDGDAFVALQLGRCIRTNRQQFALLTSSFENISKTVPSV